MCVYVQRGGKAQPQNHLWTALTPSLRMVRVCVEDSQRGQRAHRKGRFSKLVLGELLLRVTQQVMDSTCVRNQGRLGYHSVVHN